jgi:signal peptidase II
MSDAEDRLTVEPLGETDISHSVHAQDTTATEAGTAAVDKTEVTTADNRQEENGEPSANAASRSPVWERWLLFLIAGFIIFIDQYSKNLVESALELYTYWAPFPEFEHIFRISHVSNTGVAFGLFQNGNTFFTILALIVSLGIIIYNGRLGGGHKLLRLALGLQMGGALGNMIDRIRLGYVTDFVDIGPWPVWNIADLSIVTGTILLVLILFNEERQEKQAAQQAAAADEKSDPTLDATITPVDESSAS